MRKGIVIFGVFLLIIGFLALLFAGSAYSNDMTILHSTSGQIGLVFANQTEINQIDQGLGTLMGIMAFGGILLIIGAVVTALGFRGKSRKERQMESGNDEERKCRSCGQEFKNDDEARTHVCPNMISIDKPGVMKPRY